MTCLPLDEIKEILEWTANGQIIGAGKLGWPWRVIPA